MLVLLFIVGGTWYGVVLLKDPKSDMLTPAWFLDLMGRLQLTEQRLLPNWWLSAGLVERSATNGWKAYCSSW